MRFLFLIPALIGLSACVTSTPPDSVVGDYLSARLAARTNDIDGAAQAFVNANAKAPGSDEIRRNAFLYQLADGNVANAFSLAERLARDENADIGGFSKTTLAARALKAGRYGEAERLIKDAAERGFPKAPANLIEIWAIAGRDGEAVSLDKLRTIPGDEFRGFYPLHAAFLSENLGNIEEARGAYELSLRAFSGSAEIEAYGAFLERAGDDEATRGYYETLASQPGYGRFAGIEGLRRLDEGETPASYEPVSPAQGGALALYSLASGILQDTVQRRRAAQEAGFRIGEADYNIPLAMTQLSLYLAPDFDDARRLSGSILNSYGEYESAIEALSMIDPSSTYYQQAQIEIASAYEAMENTDQAIATLRKLIRRWPDAEEAQLTLAGLYAAKDRHGDAVKVMDQLIATLPEEPASIAWRFYLTRAASHLELDQWPKAEADLKRAAEIAPREATVLNYLGYSWAERGENLEEAFALIEKAVALQPSSGAIIDSLGWAHYQLGDYEEAVGHLEQAASLEPADPTITDHLGDVYWRLGRRIEARYQWQHALTLDIDEELTEKINAKLENGLPEGKQKKSEPSAEEADGQQ